jgi:hypothetical protein
LSHTQLKLRRGSILHNNLKLDIFEILILYNSACHIRIFTSTKEEEAMTTDLSLSRNALMVKLEGTKKGLGIKIVGGRRTTHAANEEHFGIFVKEIVPKELAYYNGQLKVGDQLLEVNGTSLVGVSNSEAVNKLKLCAATDTTVLLVARDITAQNEFKRLSVSTVKPTKTSQLPKQELVPPVHTAGEDIDTAAGGPPSSTSVNSDTTESSAPEQSSENVRLKDIEVEVVKTTERPPSASSDHPPPLPNSPPPDDSVTYPNETFIIDDDHLLTRTADGTVNKIVFPKVRGLGIAIKGGTTNSSPVTIAKVIPGMDAYKDGSLMVDDILVSVNGESFDNLTIDKAQTSLILAGMKPMNEHVIEYIRPSDDNVIGESSASVEPSVEVQPPVLPMAAPDIIHTLQSHTLPSHTLPPSVLPSYTTAVTEDSTIPPVVIHSLPVEMAVPVKVQPNIITAVPIEVQPSTTANVQATVPFEVQATVPIEVQATVQPSTTAVPVEIQPSTTASVQATVPIEVQATVQPITTAVPVVLPHRTKQDKKKGPRVDPYNKRFSVDHQKKFKLDKLLWALKYIGYDLTDEQKIQLRSSLHIDKDGKVVYDEFEKLVLSMFSLKLEEVQLKLVEALRQQTPNKTFPIFDPMPTMSGTVVSSVNTSVTSSSTPEPSLDYKVQSDKSRDLPVVSTKELEELKDKLTESEVENKKLKKILQQYQQENSVANEELKQFKSQLNELTSSDMSKKLAVKDCELRKKDRAMRRYEVATEKLLDFVENCHDLLVNSSNAKNIIFHQQLQGKGETSVRGLVGNPRPPLYLSQHAKKTGKELSQEAKETLQAVRKILNSTDLLPFGWEEEYDSEGRKYYVNHQEQITSWVHPETRTTPTKSVGKP